MINRKSRICVDLGVTFRSGFLDNGSTDVDGVDRFRKRDSSASLAVFNGVIRHFSLPENGVQVALLSSMSHKNG